MRRATIIRMSEAFKHSFEATSGEADFFEEVETSPVTLTVIEGGRNSSEEITEVNEETSPDAPFSSERSTTPNEEKISTFFDEPEENAASPEANEDSESSRRFELPSLEQTRQTLSVMGEKAQAFFSTLSEKGQALAGSIYEGIYKIPGVQRLAGKMEIAYNQFFVDYNQQSATNLQEKLAGNVTKMDALEQTARETEAAIEALRGLGSPNLGGLERKVIDLDKQKLNLLLGQETINQKIGARENKMEHFKGQRDIIADRLIGTYAEKLAPIERRLGTLEDSRHIAETQAEITSAEHEQQLGVLSGLEERRNSIAALLGNTGLSEKQVQRHEILCMIDGQIADGREKIRKTEEAQQRELSTINQKISRTNGRADGYRARRDEFVRLKNSVVTPEVQANTAQETVSAETPTQETATAPVENRFETEQEIQETEPEENLESGYEDADEIAELVEFLSEYLEDDKENQVTKEDKVEMLTRLLTEDPELSEFLMDIYTGPYSEQEQTELVVSFFETERDLDSDIEGLDITLPPRKDSVTKQKLVFRRTVSDKLSATIATA